MPLDVCVKFIPINFLGEHYIFMKDVCWIHFSKAWIESFACLQEHAVIESKPDHFLDDLRLNNSWPELRRFSLLLISYLIYVCLWYDYKSPIFSLKRWQFFFYISDTQKALIWIQLNMSFINTLHMLLFSLGWQRSGQKPTTENSHQQGKRKKHLRCMISSLSLVIHSLFLFFLSIFWGVLLGSGWWF